MALDGIDFDEAIASICMEMGVAYADLDRVFSRRPETINWTSMSTIMITSAITWPQL